MKQNASGQEKTRNTISAMIKKTMTNGTTMTSNMTAITKTITVAAEEIAEEIVVSDSSVNKKGSQIDCLT